MNPNTKITQYLREHCISDQVFSKYKLRWKTSPIDWGVMGITIPIFDREGNVLFNKYRMFTGDDKYRYDKGSSMALFNADKITNDIDYIWVVEGEFDAMALTEYFLDSNLKEHIAVSSTGGAGTWKKEWNEYLRGKTVKVILDNDKAGLEGACRLWEHIGEDIKSVSLNKLKNHKDICETLYFCNRQYFGLQFEQMIGEGCSYYDIAQSDTPRKKIAAIKRAFAQLDRYEARADGLGSLDYIQNLRLRLAKIYRASRPEQKKKTSYTDGDVTLEMLRKIPITNFIKFGNDNTACCIFHSERHPSMHYNPPGKGKIGNTVKCFSCGRFAGVVDVVMELNHCGFAEALEILKKHL